MLQKVPLLCEFRDSSRTLLCHAVREAAMGVLSRQQELNLLNMVTVLLAVSVQWSFCYKIVVREVFSVIVTIAYCYYCPGA